MFESKIINPFEPQEITFHQCSRKVLELHVYRVNKKNQGIHPSYHSRDFSSKITAELKTENASQ